jgi:hypothetical protein
VKNDDKILKDILDKIKTGTDKLTKSQFNKKCFEGLCSSPYYSEDIIDSFPELWEEYKVWVFFEEEKYELE